MTLPSSSLEQVTRMSATEIATHIASGSLLSREVVEAYIQRIEAVNSRLNAVVVPLFEQARAEALAADAARDRGDKLGPLHQENGSEASPF